MIGSVPSTTPLRRELDSSISLLDKSCAVWCTSRTFTEVERSALPGSLDVKKRDGPRKEMVGSKRIALLSPQRCFSRKVFCFVGVVTEMHPSVVTVSFARNTDSSDLVQSDAEEHKL